MVDAIVRGRSARELDRDLGAIEKEIERIGIAQAGILKHLGEIDDRLGMIETQLKAKRPGKQAKKD